MDLKRVARFFEQAQHNEQLAETLVRDVLPQNPEFADWVIVVYFYAALHRTKAVLLRDHGVIAYAHRSYRDEHGVVHDGHNDLVRDYLDSNVSASYKELFDRAQEARYRPLFRRFRDKATALNFVRLMRWHLDTISQATPE